VIDRAKAADSRSLAEKRPADAAVRDLENQHGSEPPPAPSAERQALLTSQERPGLMPSSERLGLTPSEVLEASSMLNPNAHPLLQLQALAELDRKDPDRVKLVNHGTWDGRWACPMVSDRRFEDTKQFGHSLAEWQT